VDGEIYGPYGVRNARRSIIENLIVMNNTKKMVFSIILIIFSLVIIVFCGWQLWVNRASENFTQIFLKITTGLLVILLLVLYEVYSPLPAESKEVKVLILRNKNMETANFDFHKRLLKTGSEHRKVYDALHDVEMLFGRKESSTIRQNDLSLDLLEMTIWLWLAGKYNLHWRVENKTFEGISGGGGTGDIANDAEKNPYAFTGEDLRETLKDNMFIVPEWRIGVIYLPSNSTVNIERTSLTRTIKISNRHIDEFKIKITSMGHSGLTYTDLGENIKKTLESPDSWYANNYRVNFEVKYDKWRRGSPETKQQKEWVSEIMADFYNDFEWSLVKPDLEKAYSTL